MTERVISADDHIDLTYLPADLWQKRLPEKYREVGPRVVNTAEGLIWEREGRRWGPAGSKRPDNRIIVYDKAGLDEEPEPGVWRAVTPRYRLKDMDGDGVHAQVLYNFLDWSFQDAELKSACITAFNSWLAEDICAAAPDRLIGLVTLPGHDAHAAVRELERGKELGLRGGFFDVFAPHIPIYDPQWELLWHAAEEMDMPISVHTGAGTHMLAKVQRGASWKFPALAAVLGMQLEEVLVTMIVSGTLERHPKLKFVLGESGIGWIPFALERMEYEVRHSEGMAGRESITTPPREIFQRQVYATFSDEDVGVRLIPEIGINNCMWAADYPHGDGTFPHSKQIIARMFDNANPEMRKKVLHDNAAKLYKIP